MMNDESLSRIKDDLAGLPLERELEISWLTLAELEVRRNGKVGLPPRGVL
jgi:hypothetical protein